MTTVKRIAFIAVLLFFFCPPPYALALTDIMQIRHWVAPDNTRIVIDTNEEAETDIRQVGQKIVIDFKNAEAGPEVPTEDFLNKPGVERIFVLPLPENSVRIEVWLKDYVETRVFKLKAFADKPYRVVIDIGLPEVEKKQSEERRQVKTIIKDKVIVIDPGHGGDDPGAIGKRGTKEKDVVLKIAKHLEKNLNNRKGYKAFLTRHGDYYPSFKKRLQIAREYGADLFVSIHADAVRKRDVRGSSVYCLSTSGASSVAARLLAGKENLADILGGAENDQAKEDTDPIMLNMVQTETSNLSKYFASAMLDLIKPLNPLKFDQVQYAPFRVLKMPEIPSVLIETAYISNPQEEKLLKSPHFQRKIADVIANSIDHVFSKGKDVPITVLASANNPVKTEASASTPEAEATVKPENEPINTPKIKKDVTIEVTEKTAPAVREEVGHKDRETEKNEIAGEIKTEKTIFYTVRKGDSLGKIAQRHNTTVAMLLKLNDININKPLYVNKRLKVPAGKSLADSREVAQEKTSASKEITVAYRVKRGDTLEKIAKRHDTTIASLLKLNDIKVDDPLYVNKRLKVPATGTGENNGIKVKKTDSSIAAPLQTPETSFYTVRRGDSLDKIARKHGTTVSTIVKLNDIKQTAPLYVNKRLKVPSEKTAENRTAIPAEKPVTNKKKNSVYRIKWGDTIEKIARKHDVSMTALLKANNMNLSDPLYADKKLIIP